MLCSTSILPSSAFKQPTLNKPTINRDLNLFMKNSYLLKINNTLQLLLFTKLINRFAYNCAYSINTRANDNVFSFFLTLPANYNKTQRAYMHKQFIYLFCINNSGKKTCCC